jgi:hypothetical protein
VQEPTTIHDVALHVVPISSGGDRGALKEVRLVAVIVANRRWRSSVSQPATSVSGKELFLQVDLTGTRMLLDN